MLTALIVDDESKGRLTLESLLNKYCPQILIVGQAVGVQDAITQIKNLQPDVVFLDIQLQDGNGFDVLKKFEEVNFNVIFTTAYDEYAVKAFRFSAVDYLLKPIDPDQLISSVQKIKQSEDKKSTQQKLETFQENQNSSEKKIVIHSHQGLTTIKVADISRCEADSNYTTIYNKNGTKIVATKSLREYEELLSEHNFFRVHKSHLINLSYVKSCDFSNNILTLDDNSTVEIARRRKEALLQSLKTN